jgi:thiol:disulfide interchange protein DsbD
MKILKRFILLCLVFVSFVEAAGFLMPDEAFKPYAKVDKEGNIVAGVKLADGIYLYKDRVKISLVDTKVFTIAKIEAPKAEEHMGDMVYFHSADFLLKLQKEKNIATQEKVGVKIEYQGCSEQGLCYEPSQKIISVSIDGSKLSGTKSSSAQKELSETDMIADTIQSSSFLVVLATFFIFGLLLSLTPCVFPMIPIISGLIISQGKGLTTKKAFMLSLVYVLAMAVAYTIAGILAGLFGANLQAALQTPWVVYAFAAIFVLLALSMFGYYELKLPDALVSRVSKNSNRSGFVGVAIMGFLSALIVGPCVAAPLAGALVYIGQTGDALLGGSALFSMSLGMGVPLIVVGVSAGKFMPKPGAWMTLVNAIFGVLMLGVAVWMLEKVLPFEVTTFMYSALGLGFALFLGFSDKEGHIFKRSVALLLFLYSLALFMSVLAGAPNLKEPLSFFKATERVAQVEKKSTASFIKVTSLDELNRLLEKNRGKKILLDFSAAWCSACKELEELTFSDKRVAKKMRDFVLIRADVTANTEQEKALSKAYGVFGPPAIIFFDKEGKVMPSKTIIGFIEADKFLTHLQAL